MTGSYRSSKALGVSLAMVVALASADAAAQRGGPQRQIVQVAGDVYRANNGNWWSIFMVTPEGIVLGDPINLQFSTWLKGDRKSTRLNSSH